MTKYERRVLHKIMGICIADSCQFQKWGKAKQPPVVVLADDIYQLVHWIERPECRKNHPHWNPFPSKSGRRRKKGK